MPDQLSQWAPAAPDPASEDSGPRPEDPGFVTAATAPPAFSAGPGQTPPNGISAAMQDPVPTAPDAQPMAPAPSVPTPPGPAQKRLHHPLRGWLIAILAVLTALLVAQVATLALLVPWLVTITYPTRTVTLVAIPTAVEGAATITTDKFVRTEVVPEGQRVAYPMSVASGATVSIMLTVSDQVDESGRITCMVLDEANRQLVNVSTVVSSDRAVTCTWTNNGK